MLPPVGRTAVHYKLKVLVTIRRTPVQFVENMLPRGAVASLWERFAHLFFRRHCSFLPTDGDSYECLEDPMRHRHRYNKVKRWEILCRNSSSSFFVFFFVPMWYFTLIDLETRKCKDVCLVEVFNRDPGSLSPWQERNFCFFWHNWFAFDLMQQHDVL